MDEKRSETRQRTFLNGVLSYQNGHATQACVVRNLSASGALIETEHPDAPGSFEIFIPMRGLRAKGRAAWRVGARMGVRLAIDKVAPTRVRAAPTPEDASY